VLNFYKINTNIFFMKKFLRTVPKEFCLGVCFGFAIFITGVCFAVTVNMGARVLGGTLDADDFNTIPQTLSGLYNDSGDLGIGMDPVSGIKLSVNGMMRVRPIPMGAGTCGNGALYRGRIYFDRDDKHFYLCRGMGGNGWLQLDND